MYQKEKNIIARINTWNKTTNHNAKKESIIVQEKAITFCSVFPKIKTCNSKKTARVHVAYP